MQFLKKISTVILFAVAASAQSPAIALPQVYTSGPIGLTSLEAARWNVLNPPLPAPMVAPTCTVTVSFHNGQGDVIKDQSITLKAGESRSLTLSPNEFPSTGFPTGLYALAVVPLTAPVDQPEPRGTCTLVTSLEVVESATGRTTALTRGQLVELAGLRPLTEVTR